MKTVKVAVPKEVREGERRVALIPDSVSRLTKMGVDVRVESGAGKAAYFSDAEYKEAGGKVVRGASSIWKDAEIVVKVAPPLEGQGRDETGQLPPGSILIGFLDPLGNPMGVKRLAEQEVTALSMEMIPRISRAQSMDALSSQAVASGYKATLLAASKLAKFFPMLTTAAGTVRPAKVFVIGAGVAGLQAIATAKRLGAVVEAFDIRPAVKEEVKSLGAAFVEVELEEDAEGEGGYAKAVSEKAQRKERELIADHVAQSDAVITTALVPGKRAPILVSKEMVEGMKPGSVVVDLAAETGGNCELTSPGKEVVHRGVTILGPPNLPSSMPAHASQMYSRNVLALLQYITKEGELNLDFGDEIIDGCCVTHQGEVRHARLREAIKLAGVGKGEG